MLILLASLLLSVPEAVCKSYHFNPGPGYQTWVIAHAGELPKWYTDRDDEGNHNRASWGFKISQQGGEPLHIAVERKPSTTWTPPDTGVYVVEWTFNKDNKTIMTGKYLTVLQCWDLSRQFV